MNVKELRRAYATLGLADGATFEQARDAFLIWATLLAPAAPGTAASPDLSRHELDLAWHAIAQAHEHGVLFPRQPRGCDRCQGTPAVRITLHTVEPGGLRARTTVTEALLCRDCGLAACRTAQRRTLRRGWWGMLAPFANLRAIVHNSSERAFVRRIEPMVPRPRSGGPDRVRQRGDSAGLARSRVVGWFAGIGAVALIIGVAIPAGSDPTPGHGSHSSAPSSSSTSGTTPAR